MGTILKYRNIRFVIYTKDHIPAHVHAISPKGEAKIELGTCVCYYSRGYSQKDLGRIVDFVESHKELLMEAWNEFHQEE